MNFEWTERSIRLYREASAYTGFHENLSAMAAPYLDASWSLADFGCGPGLLDLHLASMVAKVTAIDSEEAAIENLRAEIRRATEIPGGHTAVPVAQEQATGTAVCPPGISVARRDAAGRIEPVLRDLCELSADEKWDAVVMSFVGMDARLLDDLVGRARKRALLFFRHRSFDPDAPEVLGAPETERHLTAQGYSFTKTVTELEFGQPFRSLPDAEDWIADLAKRKEAKARKAREALVDTGRSDFPYFIPKTVKVTFFAVAPKEL